MKTWCQRGLLAMVGFLLLSLGACVVSPSQLRTLEANNAFALGANQDAIKGYLRAQSTTPADQAVLAYDLANLYNSLGENEAAFRLWNQSLTGADDDLRFNVQFNRGIVLYESGKYDEALGCFREALRLKPGSLDAKINLELSFQKKNSAESHAGAGSAPTEPVASPGPNDSSNLLDYVRRKEGARWFRNPTDATNADDR